MQKEVKKMEKINYYHFFGVNKESSAKDICNAVIKLKDNFDEKYGMLGEVATDAILSAIWDGFTILTDPEKKEIYDIYGEEGLNKEFNLQQRGKEAGRRKYGKNGDNPACRQLLQGSFRRTAAESTFSQGIMCYEKSPFT